MAAGEGVEPSISDFKNQRAAGVTPSRMKLIGAAGVEPATLRLSAANTVYKTAALPIELRPVICW